MLETEILLVWFGYVSNIQLSSVMKHHTKIMQIIETNIEKKGKVENTLKLIDKIMMTYFEIIENPLSKLVYDPTQWV